MKAELPPLASVSEIQKRLLEIFPEGTPNRTYCTREIAAKTVFAMLYPFAVESRGAYIRPNQVTRMTDAQSRKTTADERLDWAKASLAKEHNIPGRRIEECDADHLRRVRP